MMNQYLLYLAILPAAVLIIFIWKKDTVEKEPPGLLARLFVGGAVSTVSATVIGNALDIPLALALPETSLPYLMIENFLVVALVEEGGKYFFLKRTSWNHPAFNYTFDAVVYAVLTSLGFATIENILYVWEGGFGTALVRAVISVPGHAIFAVFMGAFYGAAKRAELMGNSEGCRRSLRLALIVPMLLHGFFDFCLSLESAGALAVFYAFELLMTVVALNLVNRMSAKDAPLPFGTNAENLTEKNRLPVPKIPAPGENASFEVGGSRERHRGFDI